MVTPENTMSLAGRHALQDMVELQMYLVAQAQHAPWPMLPRGADKARDPKRLYGNMVELSAVHELMDQGFIEGTSSRTFVVSKSGYQFYKREMKPHFSLIHGDPE
jgi:hypothetical protein